MARGANVYRGNVTASGALVTPAADECVWLKWISMGVSAAGTSIVLSDGNGGGVVARLGTGQANTSGQLTYMTGARQYDGNPLTVGKPLYATITGGGVDVEVGYEIR